VKTPAGSEQRWCPPDRGPQLFVDEHCAKGIRKAKGEGKYKGCKPTARAKAADTLRLAAEGEKRKAIATQLGIGVASVYRVLARARA
jgi:DNA invertase Pin-like site-specific DNA recombinase